jgi:hypothetical protein
MAYLRLYPVDARRGIQQFTLLLDRRCPAILQDQAASVMRVGCSRLNPLSTFACLRDTLCAAPLPT